ncbi:MAG: outer membrane beta-barrel protein [Deltaproteobacteria bacterium]|nr:outer membrane beta-barrel protein [Deltaproteobacteria bacterium]
MNRIVMLLAFACFTQNVFANEGFYVSLGVGADMFYGEQFPSEVIYKNGSPVVIISGNRQKEATTDIVSTDLGNMPAVDFNMGYNILNYASIELKLNFTGSDISKKGERKGGGFISGVAKYHPINHWKKNYFVDPYIFLGGGYSMIGMNVEEWGFVEKQSKAIAGGFFEMGLGTDLYIKKWFSIFLDLNFYFPSYSKFYYDWDKDIIHEMNTTPDTVVFSIVFGSRFHFNIKE